MGATYKANYRGIGQLLAADFLVANMRARAERVKAAAEAIAPEESGQYKSSFRVESGVRTAPDRRAYGRVENTAPYALQVEFGTKKTPRHRVLGRALDAAKD